MATAFAGQNWNLPTSLRWLASICRPDSNFFFFSLVLTISKTVLSYDFFFRINALEEQIESQKVTTGKQVEEESLKYKLALVGFWWCDGDNTTN